MSGIKPNLNKLTRHRFWGAMSPWLVMALALRAAARWVTSKTWDTSLSGFMQLNVGPDLACPPKPRRRRVSAPSCEEKVTDQGRALPVPIDTELRRDECAAKCVIPVWGFVGSHRLAARKGEAGQLTAASDSRAQAG